MAVMTYQNNITAHGFTQLFSKNIQYSSKPLYTLNFGKSNTQNTLRPSLTAQFHQGYHRASETAPTHVQFTPISWWNIISHAQNRNTQKHMPNIINKSRISPKQSWNIRVSTQLHSIRPNHITANQNWHPCQGNIEKHRIAPQYTHAWASATQTHMEQQ